jgi:hypothetical protein
VSPEGALLTAVLAMQRKYAQVPMQSSLEVYERQDDAYEFPTVKKTTQRGWTVTRPSFNGRGRRCYGRIAGWGFEDVRKEAAKQSSSGSMRVCCGHSRASRQDIFSADALRQPMRTRELSAARKLSANAIEFRAERKLTLFNAQLNVMTIYFILCSRGCDPRPVEKMVAPEAPHSLMRQLT